MSYDWDDMTAEDIEWIAICSAWRPTLGLNLAVAGALCSSFQEGYIQGRYEVRKFAWQPNVAGRAAPRWIP